MKSNERARRWRLILGGGEADGTDVQLGGVDQVLDKNLTALYDSDRRGGLGSSQPKVARWLGDIRKYFPASVVQVMQRDALERLKLHEMLLEPELLAEVEPDVHLVATLIELADVIPPKTKETARIVVRRVVERLIHKLQNPFRQSVVGSLNRSVKNRRPRNNEIDWPRTIQRNLRFYQPRYRTIIPHQPVGFGRRRSMLQHVILCVDQSASMATSVVYASVFAAVMASLPALRTSAVFFDTNVVDFSDKLADPVELLFGAQLGGGTDINRALRYCEGLVTQPEKTILVLISDLYEGGNERAMVERCSRLVGSGVQMIALLALSDDGAPAFDHEIAGALSAFAVPCFACTPDQFPDLMAAALNRRDIGQWASERRIVRAG